VCVAFAYMSVLASQHVDAVSPVYPTIPSSLSLNDLQSHPPSQPSRPNSSWNASSVYESASVTSTVVVCTSAGEFPSVRQQTVDSSLSANVFMASDSTCQSLGSYWGNSQPAVDSMLVTTERQHGVGNGASFVRPQRSVNSVLTGGVCDSCQSVETDQDVEVFSELTTSSQTNNVALPPPLPPKVSVVSLNLSVN